MEDEKRRLWEEWMHRWRQRRMAQPAAGTVTGFAPTRDQYTQPASYWFPEDQMPLPPRPEGWQYKPPVPQPPQQQPVRRQLGLKDWLRKLGGGWLAQRYRQASRRPGTGYPLYSGQPFKGGTAYSNQVSRTPSSGMFNNDSLSKLLRGW